MINSIQTLLPYGVVASQVVLVILVISLLIKNPFARWVGKNALVLGFLMSLAAVLGSLFYSELVGFEPCVLCWWQRVFLYPQVVLFAIALWKKDRGVFKYSVALASFAGVLALYQSYVYWGGESILPCTALGGACSKNFVYAFGGYVNIPAMSLTIVLYLLLLAWINKTYRNENRHA